MAGLPPKPYVPPTAAAPPLPAGPAPPQPAYNAQDPAAAHAAAWAAYYQSQGLTAQGQPQSATGYTAQPQAGPIQPAGASSNPYANYGYGAQAAQAHLHGGPTAPGQRPPANVAPQQQGYQYNQQQGYASPAPFQGGPSQGYAGPGPGQGGYSQPQQGYQGWGGQGGGPQQQGYRPPQGPGQGQGYQPGPPGVGPQQPYFNGPPGGGSQQPYTPPHPGGQTPYRHNPSHSPAPMSQNRPYQPQPMAGPRQSRPPMNQNQGPTPPHHPPAKRPRFDGPGPGPGGGPTHLGGPGRASLPVRPGTGSIPARPPSGPRTPLPPPPIARPPIHLGTGGPPPVFAPGGPRNNAGPMRGGGERGRGRGGMVMNAPRGPSHMRRERQDSHQRQRSARPDTSPGKKDGRKDKKKEKEKDAKTTLTDFRIVGIEMKDLGWKWGLVGEEAMNQAEEKEQVKPEETEIKTEQVNGEEAESGAGVSTDEQAKEEAVDTNTDIPVETDDVKEPTADIEPTADTDTAIEAVKEEPSVREEDLEANKTGGKRKAQSPETDEGSSKKKSTYLLTHGKANDLPSHESSQNRFRIYFESPPEADRIPQALRRNPYKRWRREDSAAPVDVAGEKAVEGGKEADLSVIDEVEKTQETSIQQSAGNGDEIVDDGEENVTANATAPTTAAPEVADGSTETTAVETVETPAVPEIATDAQDVEAVDPAALLETTDNTTPAAVAETTIIAEEPATIPDVVIETDVEAPTTEAEQAPVSTEPPKEDELPPPPPADTEPPVEPTPEAVDPLTSTEPAAAAAAVAEAPAPMTAEETAAAIAQSAENAASAYKSRTRRRSSVSSTDSRETQNAFQPEVTPSLNRLSILYEGSQRRMCFDAEVVEMIRVYRAEGRIEVCFTPLIKSEIEIEDEPENSASTSTLLPKGYLLEEYNQEDQRFAPVSKEKLEELYSNDESFDSIPPLHRHFATTSTTSGLQLSVYLNKKNPLSVPRWCRNNSADEWLYEQFGTRPTGSGNGNGWRSKLQVMDPDPPPTLSSILENWSSSSSSGNPHKRTAFTNSLLSEPYDLLEILLRLTRGDRNPTAPGGGPLATSIRSDSPYANHQTHVSLAILAMYRLTTDYAQKAGEKSEVVNEKIGDIIKSLPAGMISRSLDGMFKEWDGRGKGGK